MRSELSAPGTPTTAQLVTAALDGDAQAMHGLLAAHEEGITAVCRRYLRGHDVGDGVQETFARAMQQLHQLRDPHRFGPWVRAIARSVSCDMLAVGTRTITVPDLLVETASEEPAPELELVASEDRRELRLRLSSLSERDARALWLRDGHGTPVPEVAAELGVTEGSARVLLSRARARLREAYTGVAALLGLWRGALRERLPVVGDVPAWVAAVPVATMVALTLVALAPEGAPLQAGDGSGAAAPDAPTRSIEPRRDLGAAPADDGPAPADVTAPAPDDEEAAPGPVLSAGPVSVGGQRPDDAPVASVGGEDPDSHGAEIFAGNLGALVDDPHGAVTGAGEHALDVVGDAAGGSHLPRDAG